jgi:hypothetical protein
VRRAALIVAIAASAVSVSGAGAVEDVKARYAWSVSGTLDFTWSTRHSSEPCDAVGSGKVHSTFSGKGQRPFQVGSNQYGPFYDYDPSIHVHGTITESDNTRQNPPEPGGHCMPTDKSGCRTVKLRSFTTITLDAPARRGYPWKADGNNFPNAFDGVDHKCRHEDFFDFGFVRGSIPLSIDEMPSNARLLAGRAGTVQAVSRRTFDNGRQTLRRTLTFTFKRVR